MRLITEFFFLIFSEQAIVVLCLFVDRHSKSNDHENNNGRGGQCF